MVKLLEIHNLPRINHEEIENLNMLENWTNNQNSSDKAQD